MKTYRQHLHRRDLLLVTEADFKDLDERLAPQRRALADHYSTACAIPKPAPRKRSPKVLEQARQRGHCENCGRRCRPHPHHVTTRGAGGGDSHENIVSLCPDECHPKAHSGELSKATLLGIVARRGK